MLTSRNEFARAEARVGCSAPVPGSSVRHGTAQEHNGKGVRP